MRHTLTILMLVLTSYHSYAEDYPKTRIDGISTVRCAKATEIVVTEFNKGREKGDELKDAYFTCLYESDDITYIELKGDLNMLGIIAYYVDISNKKIVKSVTAY